MADNFENIDRYFGGEMGMEEMQQFEQAVTQDPQLSREFSFQKELVEGIKAARKAELKATLANIDVSTIPTGAEVSTLTKVLGGLTIAGIVAIGTYFTLGDKQDAVPSETMATSEVVEQVTPVDQSSTTTEASKPTELTKASTPESVTQSVIDENISEIKEAIVINEANVNEGFEDETEVSDTEPPTNHLIAKSKMNHSSLEVSIEKSKKYSFHYLVKNNSLSLFGDFTNLYEVIEFHKDGNTTTYLKYDEKYYLIDKLQSKAAPLVALSENALLNLLDSIENNKER